MSKDDVTCGCWELAEACQMDVVISGRRDVYDLQDEEMYSSSNIGIQVIIRNMSRATSPFFTDVRIWS